MEEKISVKAYSRTNRLSRMGGTIVEIIIKNKKFTRVMQWNNEYLGEEWDWQGTLFCYRPHDTTTPVALQTYIPTAPLHPAPYHE
jgi:hypothetical protein